MSMDERELLRIQAYLDHELSPADCERVAEWLAGNEEGRALYEELRQTRALVTSNEIERTVPESREFYWSKIQRQIQLETAEQPQRPFRWTHGWLRFALSASGVAALIACVFAFFGFGIGNGNVAPWHQEIDSPHLEVNAITFHSEEAGLTVVWIENQGPYWSETDSND